MSRVAAEVVLTEMEQEILWGIASVTQELTNNYEKILKSKEESTNWSQKEVQTLKTEKQHLENLQEHLEAVLNRGENLRDREAKKIIEEDRNAEKVEKMLEKKEENGNLELGGKKTVKLTKSLTELTESLHKIEESEHVHARETYEEEAIQAIKDELMRVGDGYGFNTDNGNYIIAGSAFSGEPKLEKEYQKSDFMVIDSVGHSFEGNTFKKFMKNQPEAGSFDYEEMMAENIMRNQLPVIIPDVLPAEEYRGIPLEHYNKGVLGLQAVSQVMNKGVLPVTAGLASSGILPVKAALIGQITIGWNLLGPVVLNALFLPRFATATGARLALLAEKIEEFAAQNKKHTGKPTLYLHLPKTDLAILYILITRKKLRRKVIGTHKAMGFKGLKEQYLDLMKTVKFGSSYNQKIMLEYQGQSTIQNYREKTVDTGIISNLEIGE